MLHEQNQLVETQMIQQTVNLTPEHTQLQRRFCMSTDTVLTFPMSPCCHIQPGRFNMFVSIRNETFSGQKVTFL